MSDRSEDILGDILDEMSVLPGVVGGIVAGLAGSITTGMTAVTAALDRTTAAVGKLNSLFERMFATAMQNRGGPQALPAHGNLQAEPVSPPAGGVGVPGAGGGLASLAKAGAIAAAALGAVAIAVSLAEQQLRKMEGFVRLFNPGVVTMFRQALDNLGATVGRAFVPVIQNATEVVRQWAGILAPTMAQLVPVVKYVSDLIANTLMRGLQQFGAVIRAAVPLFKVFFEVLALIAEVAAGLFNALGNFLRVVILVARTFYELSGLGTAVRILTKVFEAFGVVSQTVGEALSIVEVVITSLVDSLLAWVGSLLPFGEIMGGLNRAVEYVIRNMYVWAVLLAKFAGAMGVVDALIAHVEGKLKTSDVAAQQPQIKSLEQLSRDLALAAAAAGGAAGQGGVRNQQEFWQKTLEEMRAARASGMTIRDFLQSILDHLKTLVDSTLPAPVANAVHGAVAVAGGIAAPDNPRGAMVGGIIGHVVGGPGGLLAGRYVGGRQ